MVRHVALGGRLLALCCILTGPAAGPAIAALVPAVPSGYSVQWSDEFNGTALNTDIWRPTHAYTTSWSVGGGALKLTTYTDGNGVDQQGEIDTSFYGPNGYEQKYGYIVARIKLQDQPGTCSAFWLRSRYMNPTETGNPALDGTEMDIFEHVALDGNSQDISNKQRITVHWYTDYSAPDWGHKSSTMLIPNLSPAINDGDFHLYALLWTPTKYEFYIDNILRRTFTSPISQRQEFFSFMCAPTDASFGGPRPAGGYGPLGSASNAVETVDYIRAYAVPEPSASMLAITGAMSMSVYAWRKRK
jgi:beta-glucanase (GH16 family)